LQIFLLGSAFGALLHQRGALVLHAGAVAVKGEAVLFCGASGSGKSSLVAALSAAGYPAIADDVCLIQTDGSSRPMVAPDGRRLKLWADAMSSLSIGSGGESAVRPGILKFWVDPQTPASPEAIPLRAAYFLRAEAPPHRAGIEPLSTLAALDLLRQNAYRPRLVKILGQEADWLERSLSVMRAGEAFHLTRRWSFDALPGCIEGLQRHWETGRCTPPL
jgi:energy-coupling factor transporter ATP-binding protein EcfA2